MFSKGGVIRRNTAGLRTSAEMSRECVREAFSHVTCEVQRRRVATLRVPTVNVVGAA